MLTNKSKKLSQNNQCKPTKLIATMMIVLLAFSYCSQKTQGEKSEDTRGEKEKFLDNIFTIRLIQVVHQPKFVYSVDMTNSVEKICENYYYHGRKDFIIDNGIVSNSKCEYSDEIVGVCVVKSTNVVETLYYSDKYTSETAYSTCFENLKLNQDPNQKVKVKVEFRAKYNYFEVDYLL